MFQFIFHFSFTSIVKSEHDFILIIYGLMPDLCFHFCNGFVMFGWYYQFIKYYLILKSLRSFILVTIINFFIH